MYQVGEERRSAMRQTYRHACGDCHARSALAGRTMPSINRGPGCEICAVDANRSNEMCGGCDRFTMCDYCGRTDESVARVFYERRGHRVADVVCASCLARHPLTRGS
jgi:hypothetical protein